MSTNRNLKITIIVLSLDVMDESGDHISEYDHDVYKERLDASGRSILKEKSEGTNFICAIIMAYTKGEIN
jgi:hypothetical protein